MSKCDICNRTFYLTRCETCEFLLDKYDRLRDIQDMPESKKIYKLYWTAVKNHTPKGKFFLFSNLKWTQTRKKKVIGGVVVMRINPRKES